MSENASWWEALYEKLTGRPHPARTPLPACGMRGCIETYAHSHAPDTGWIRPEEPSWAAKPSHDMRLEWNQGYDESDEE